ESERRNRLQLVDVHLLHFFFFSSRRRHTRWPRDWSSDVCSSDLAGLARTDDRIERRSPSPPARITAIVRFTGASLSGAPAGRSEIGRASCRERVWMSVVAGALKKRGRGTRRAGREGGGSVEELAR